MALSSTSLRHSFKAAKAVHAPQRVVSENARIARSLRLLCHAETETSEPSTSTVAAAAPAMPKPADAAAVDESWVPVMAPEDLPKGVRKEVSVGGSLVLLFWYRNQIYAISSRSPAEGAYSEGFIKAKFTQDYGIICPTTGSVFSLKDGSVVDWYPDNPVLRSISPQSGALPIYPVKLTQDAIMVQMGDQAARLAPTRGGADSSLESNNVFAIQPSVYIDESTDSGSGSSVSTAATLTVAITCFAIVATAGTATALYYEDFALLGGFWLLMLTVGGFFAFKFSKGEDAL